MPPIVMTVEFSLFPDGTVLGPAFVLGGFAFADLGTAPSSVKESGAGKGLQFERTGVRVKLPALTDAVSVRGAAFAGDSQVLGEDAAGNVLTAQRIPGDRAPHTIELAHPGMQFVRFVDGGDEGSIEAISMTVCNDGPQPRSGGPLEETVLGLVRSVDLLSHGTILPEQGAELVVRTTSPLISAALYNAAASGDRVAVTYVIEDGVRVVTRLQVVGR